jgi:hypothetical protein
LGLTVEQFTSMALEFLHRVIPSFRNLFDWTDSQGNLIRYFFEGPIDHPIAAHYFQEFHSKREADVMPTFLRAVTGPSEVQGAHELETPSFFRSALCNEIWRPQGLHTRLEAVVKGRKGTPLGSLVLYRGKREQSFNRHDEQLLAQVARYVAHGIDNAPQGLASGDILSRHDRRVMLSLIFDGSYYICRMGL